MLNKLIIATVITAAAASSFASEDSKNFYFQLNGGLSYGQEPKGDFSYGDLGKSGIYGFAAGYNLHEDVSVDLSLDYRPGFSNHYQIQEDSLHTMDSSIKVKSWTAMLNFNYNLVRLGDFTPYATAGLGASRNETNQASEVRKYNDGHTQTEIYSKGTKTDFAWKAGLGTKYSINNSFSLDLRYQYAYLGEFVTGKSSSIDGGSYESVPVESGTIKSHEVLLGVAYKF